MILVTVGTHGMPFDRLLAEVDRLHVAGALDPHEVVVQAGACTHTCQRTRQFAYCPGPDFDTLLDAADIVISHGGIGTLLPALRRGKRVIAIPRLREYGEHHNDHQVEVCAELARQQVLFTSARTADLSELLARDPSGLRAFNPPSAIVAHVRADLLAFQATLRVRGERQ